MKLAHSARRIRFLVPTGRLVRAHRDPTVHYFAIPPTLSVSVRHISCATPAISLYCRPAEPS
ncbi:hypothetical protein NSND_63425 [Nitrospira sp. ND1]|nr:hypothetical protein NSND_63425 [Nitrospira sp. ND1]